MSWSRRQVEVLLEEYKQHPILYSIKHKYSRNKTLRAMAVKEIFKKVKVLRPETVENEVMQKIRGLRGTYIAERKKQLSSLGGDVTSNNEIYQPTIWYYDYLSFLNDNIMTREKDPVDEPDSSKARPDSQIDYNSDELTHHDSSSGFRSVSTSDPLSELEIENETKFSFNMDNLNEDVEPPSKQIRTEHIESQHYSADSNDNGWLHYLSTLLNQIKNPQKKTLLRHRITRLMYEEIEKEFMV